MSPNVLVFGLDAQLYANHLKRLFPELLVHPAQTLAVMPTDPSEVDVLVSFGPGVNDELISRLTRLKWIQALGTGTDHFLRCASLQASVIVTTARGIHGKPLRETVVYLMLALSRQSRMLEKNQSAHKWERTLWDLLYGKTAVIVGVGVIGTSLAELLKAFGMRVIGISRTPRNISAFDYIGSSDRLVEIAREADYLIDVLPGTSGNHNAFDATVFGAMKHTAFFINIGRGETVNESALIDALKANRIAGAGLDVFRTEPLPTDSPLWDMPNVIVLPHIGGFVHEYEDFVLPILDENMRLFLAGRDRDMRNRVEH
jgi:D-2-hydroxyacid dehydrogenase (NADP+)